MAKWNFEPDTATLHEAANAMLIALYNLSDEEYQSLHKKLDISITSLEAALRYIAETGVDYE